MPAKKAKRFFIVNPHGTIHEVDEDHARWRLSQVGYRQAKKAEVDQYLATKIQRFDRPIGEPHSTEPEPLEV